MKFSVGDVCIVIRSQMLAFPVGCEVVIVDIDDVPCGPMNPYVIHQNCETGYRVFAGDHNLKRKDLPPREELGSWDLCPDFERKMKLEKIIP